MEKQIKIALAGNPNCGKTTLFNALTGSNQFVGNWPGVTVEKKEGKLKKHDDVVIMDLPGIYSLSPYTLEEVVARNYLIEERPDAILNIIDGTNLERNLYLTTQLTELGIPVVIAVNMMDVVRKNGDQINVKELSRQLGCEIVEISALKGDGVTEAAEAAVKAAQGKTKTIPMHTFSGPVEHAIAHIEEAAVHTMPEEQQRWYAIKIFERDDKVLAQMNIPAETMTHIETDIKAAEKELDDDAESIITNERYVYIAEVIKSCYKKKNKGELSVSDKIDRVVTNRWLGLPIFAIVMFLVYYIAMMTVGSAATDWANDGLFGDGWLYTGTEQYEAAVEEFEGILETDEGVAAFEAGELEEPDPADYGFYHVGVPVVVGGWLESIGAAPWVQSLVLDGIIAGVGAVIGFIPQLIVLFILLGFLEGCGYMARVAFIMDRVFRRFGLSGKSFIPMLIASGCGVPAVMATKTIENEKDRRMTIMTTTMIPCGAKLPIIALVFGALAGGDYEATWWVAPVFYFLGLFAIILSCIILKKFRAFSGEVAPFIMELPQYHLPTVKNVLLSMWERVRSYVVKAGTIIFLSSMVIWFLLNFGFYEGSFGLLDPEVDDYIQYSLMAGLGNLLAWIFAPLGFGNWESTVTSITGLVAKENVVATVGVITSLGEEIGETDPSLWASFAAMLGGSSAAIMAFCAFNLLCAPCFAAIGTIRRQMMSAKWTWAAIGYMCAFAWCVGLMIYQFGGLIAGEIAFGPFTALAVVVAAGMLYLLFRPAAKPKGAGRLEAARKNA